MNLITHQGYLLSQVSNLPYIGLSARKINPNYTGPCIQVRRKGEPELYDIGFDENGRISLDELRYYSGAEIKGESVGSPFQPASLLVSIWYNQGGGVISYQTLVSNQE